MINYNFTVVREVWFDFDIGVENIDDIDLVMDEFHSKFEKCLNEIENLKYLNYKYIDVNRHNYDVLFEEDMEE